MRYFPATLKTKILIFVVSAILFTALTIMFLVRSRTIETFLDSHDSYSNNILNYINVNVENQYQSILFHKESVLALTKADLKSKTEIVLPIIDKYKKLADNGIISISEAKHKAASEISKIRYGKGVGYFWINDIERPYPKMIMHPTIPSLNGQVLDDKEFNCALGKGENLFKAFVDVCLEHSEGYVDYLWPKPTNNGLTIEQPKISYVTIFLEWDWIIGTGVYIDDIESEVNLRLEAVIEELNESISFLNTEKSGYIFIFDGNKNLLAHPYMNGKRPMKTINKLTGNIIYDDFVEAYKKGVKYIDYKWNKETDTLNYIYKKRAYISYFKPLDWYIASAYYIDHINTPINILSNQIILAVAIVLVVSLIISVLLTNSITRPIFELSNSVIEIEKHGISKTIKHIKGSLEIVKLSSLINEMIKSINKSQKALKKSEMRLRNYIDYAPDAVFIIDKEGNIHNCNKQAVNILGCNGLNNKGKSLFEFVSKSNQTKLASLLNKIIAKGSFEDELKFNEKSGKKIFSLFSGSMLKTGEIICFLKDIQQIKSYQKELLYAKQKAEESNRLKTAFLANMSHEIRTPMNGVVGFTQLISDPELPNEDRMKYSEIISKSSMQLLSVVNDIIDISKIEAGLITIEKEKIKLKEFINELFENYHQQALDKGIELITDVNDHTVRYMYADPTKLRQIMDNLLSNALKFTKNGLIKFGCKFDKRELIFYVEDSGIGLSKNDQQIIFDRFTQANSNADTNSRGTGLGLSISKAFVEQMKGSIWVESELNKGATFYFSVPQKHINLSSR